MRDITEIESDLRVAKIQQEIHRDAIANLTRALEGFERQEHKLVTELLAAKAAADSDAYPVGTRVKHYLWPDITGTVVESDGTGLTIKQDASELPSGGFSKGEWEEI